MFNPEKISVYSRYLPKGVYYNDDWVKHFFAELDSLGVNYVDNSQLLREKSYFEQVFNKKYDAGHWNDLGMFYGLNNLFNKMSYDFPSVRELTFDDFDISYQNMKTLPVSHFAINEDVPVFKKKIDVENVTKLFVNEISLNNNYHTFIYLKNKSDNCDELPRILLFQGSYLNRKSDYIINNAKEAISVHNYQNVLDADYYINLFKPDCVVFDVAEYVFSNTYFDFNRMCNLEFPASYNTFLDTVESLPLQKETLFAEKREGGAITSVTLKNAFENVKNAYFFCNFDVYDLKNTNGVLHFSRMNSDDFFDTGEVLVEIENGSCYRYPIIIRNWESSLNNISSISNGVDFLDKNEISLGDAEYITSGAKFLNDTYSFKTEVVGNAFNSLVIQLYDPRLNTYKALCVSSKENSIIRNAYHHQSQTGEYLINIRANSNKSDEWISYKVTLEKDKDYCFDFIIDSLTSNNLVTHGFHFYETGRKVLMQTDIKDNNFNNVVIQLYDPYKKEYFNIDSTKSKLNNKIYTHRRQTGDFIINLKCNSNKKDELISYNVHLENGKNYMYDLIVDSFNNKKVSITDFNFFE